MDIPTDPEVLVLETRMAHVWKRPDGVVCTRIKPGVVVDAEAARETNRACRQVAGARLCRPMLTDVSAPHTTERSARDYGVSEDSVEIVWKLALKVATPVSWMIASVFVKTRQPPYATRVFTSTDQAIPWLLEGWHEPS